MGLMGCFWHPSVKCIPNVIQSINIPGLPHSSSYRCLSLSLSLSLSLYLKVEANASLVQAAREKVRFAPNNIEAAAHFMEVRASVRRL